MAIISGGCSGAQTLKLYKPSFFLSPIKTLTLTPNPNPNPSPKPQRFLQSPRFPCIIRAFSSPAAQIAAAPAEEVKDAAFSKPQPQWRAAIDFKWIRENRDLVAANIKNRNSTANLELVLELYDRFLGVQKVRPLIFCCFGPFCCLLHCKVSIFKRCSFCYFYLYLPSCCLFFCVK